MEQNEEKQNRKCLSKTPFHITFAANHSVSSSPTVFDSTMNSSYQKLNTLQLNSEKQSINMPGRTPSFIVVGLVIIMFLFGVFYMSCSSKNTELRLSLEQFEERIRSLTLKNSDADKKYENLNIRKRELEEEKADIRRQMEKKDSEINDLNTKLNEKRAEVSTLNDEKKVADEQLKEYRSLKETIAGKNSVIEKLQIKLNDQKQADDDQLAVLKREYEVLKNNSRSSNSEASSTFIIPPQRFRPLDTNNFTTKSIASLFQDSLNKSSNLTHEIKVRFASAALDMKEKFLNVFGGNTNHTTSTVIDQQQGLHNDQHPQEVGQNVPVPPLANQAQRQQQVGHVESAQAAPQSVGDDRAAVVDNRRYQNKLQRSLTNSLSDNRERKVSDLNDHDDEEELNFDNVQANRNLVRQNDDTLVEAPVVERKKRKNLPKADRGRFPRYRNHAREGQRLDNGEELDANEEDRQVRKRNVL